MRLDDLAELMRQLEAGLVALGVSREAARQAVMDAEVVAVQDLAETQADVRLLDLFDAIGCAGVAERYRVTPRTIYSRRTEALTRLQLKDVRRVASDSATQEAA